MNKIVLLITLAIMPAVALAQNTQAPPSKPSWVLPGFAPTSVTLNGFLALGFELKSYNGTFALQKEDTVVLCEVVNKIASGASLEYRCQASDPSPLRKGR